jgi:hypothetical protein
MAAIARSHGLEVEEATFEGWDPMGRRFDLLIAGQSWHWVDQQDGPAKAVSCLAPRGRFAAFWNDHQPESAIRAALDGVTAELAPQIVAEEHGPFEPRCRDWVAALVATNGFQRWPGIHDYEASVRISRHDWIDRMLTESRYIALDPSVREELVRRTGEVIDVHGGELGVHLETWLVTGRRADRAVPDFRIPAR